YTLSLHDALPISAKRPSARSILQRIVARLPGRVEAVRQAAIGADVAAADEPLAVALDELGILPALLVKPRRGPDALVDDAGPAHVRRGPVPVHLDDRVGQLHVVARPR